MTKTTKIQSGNSDELVLDDALVAAGNLIIKNGVNFSMESGEVYTFNNITIQKGGTLSFDGMKKGWTIIRCLGMFKLKGKIISRNFPAKAKPKETVSLTDTDGTVLTHTYLNNKNGGAGGRGGGWNHLPHLAGGHGAPGTSSYGGGGGGGAGNQGCRRCATAPGANGSGRNGGSGGQVPTDHDGGRGGLGGLKESIDGGLLFLDCRNNFDGAGGIVNVAGNRGANGQRGLFVNCGAGGGGGGAPGGNGGKLILRVAGDFLPPTVRKRGGEGGKQGGSTPGSTDWNPPVATSSPGSDGERGNPGKVEFL